MNGTKIWYITGASKGMGLLTVKKLLEKGYKVAATSRTAGAFESISMETESFLPLQVDLKDQESIDRSIQKAIEKFGGLDVIVNNAGYGLGGSIEELSYDEIEDNFLINFFAAAKVIKSALPYLRTKRSGYIINVSSIAGFAPGMGWSIYSAAKSALTGFSEALANDLKPLGILVTAVLPGWFRTDFAKPHSIVYGRNQMADYEFLRASREKMKDMDGKQPGDPAAVADVFIKITEIQDPPQLLFLGTDSVQRAQEKISTLSKQIMQWKDWSLSTDFSS